VAGICEYGNELLGSIKCREFLDLLEKKRLSSQERLCSMEEVSISSASHGWLMSYGCGDVLNSHIDYTTEHTWDS
jgi:hypothetical protein